MLYIHIHIYTFEKIGYNFGNHSDLNHVLRTIPITKLFFPKSHVDKGERTKHISLEKPLLIVSFFNNGSIRDFPIIKLHVGEKTYRGMHTVLNIKQVFVVAEQYQSLKQASPKLSLLTHLHGLHETMFGSNIYKRIILNEFCAFSKKKKCFLYKIFNIVSQNQF